MTGCTIWLIWVHLVRLDKLIFFGLAWLSRWPDQSAKRPGLAEWFPPFVLCLVVRAAKRGLCNMLLLFTDYVKGICCYANITFVLLIRNFF